MKHFSVVLGLVFTAALLFITGCDKAQTTAGANANPQATGMQSAQTSTADGTVMTVTVGSTPFSVEIATTDEEREKGLSGREKLPENNGMLFVHPQTGQDSHWMKDTKIPLDMIFIDEVMTDEGISKPGKVVHIIENAVPESTELLSSPVPYRYTLEVNGGAIKKSGIKVGDVVVKSVGPLEK